MFCKYCGKEIKEGVKFCRYCGGLLASKTPSTKEKVPHKYGAFWPRFGAYFVDLTLILVILIMLVFLFGVYWGPELDNIIGFVALVAYHTFFLSFYSSTPGKMLFGLRVVNEKTGEKLNFGKALGRSLSYFVSSIAFGFGYLKIALDKEKHKGWHDSLAGTVVLQKEYNKTAAVIIAIIAIVVYLVVVIYGYTTEDEFSPYPIRSGTREIQNQLSLNPELFSESGRLQPSSGKSALNYPRTPREKESASDFSELSFDLRKELAAVVVVACPIDYSDGWNLGSGTIISEEGVILTNYHVIKDTTQYYCTIGITNDLSKEPEYIFYADYIFSIEGNEFTIFDEKLDVALLQIVEVESGYQFPKKFPAISKIGSSDKLNINDKIYVVGYPSFGGGTITFTEGVMSGRLGDDLIKTSAKIDSGNSGGAAFNNKGELIGIPTLIGEGMVEGLGYVVGIDSVKYWLGQIFK